MQFCHLIRQYWCLKRCNRHMMSHLGPILRYIVDGILKLVQSHLLPYRLKLIPSSSFQFNSSLQFQKGSGAQELARDQHAPCRSLGTQARAAGPRCADRGCRRTYFGGLHAVVPLHHSSMDDTMRYHRGSPVRSRSTDDDTLCTGHCICHQLQPRGACTGDYPRHTPRDAVSALYSRSDCARHHYVRVQVISSSRRRSS
ncbi:uncharacterized protein LOC130825508 [Amaranthus tricolor]|uniref:uncharacterized protein LOC130825508 n=1 Tax=Amaranthus tricolor TaxID=29722 RepID=UPI0025860E7F|nr:uncharacterized protein LOC130825508 [Amaranthus tricolor]